ncbi:MAG: fluoride efflux transporter CrcB [Bacteroidota bacterium]|jgi:CrcB protein|nr:fluoride efflux transporter CrcB [Cytophagales bacterium]MCE2958786.1 fluoride efflux transporter CrcB [Flammeovirgaceae bacterium]MCZ8071345.1 fluoride efflux transporter CrcB [Cytophagales bacterium]
MRQLLLVFFGGGLGSVTRFVLGKWISTLHQHHFPWGTLAANVGACLAVGFFIGLADHKQIISPASRIFWVVGFCGGFSTFSTFSVETINLIQQGFTISSFSYVLASVALCLCATFAGLQLGEM